MLRLFLAVDLPEGVRQEVAALCTEVNQARWVKPHQLHITLRFMGKTPDHALQGIRQQLASVRSPSFDLSLRSAGTFPSGMNAKRSRVLWLGIEPAAPLAVLKHEIEARLGPDLERPNQEYSPHLTLARLTEHNDATLTQFVSRHRDYRSVGWRVDSFRLYRSTLHPSGSVHEVMETYGLV